MIYWICHEFYIFKCFLTSKNKMMHQISYDFYWSIKKRSNWAKKPVFWLILSFFLFMPFFTVRVTPQDLAKWETLLRYISVVGFINIAFVDVKLKIFKLFHIDSASMKWPLFVGVLGPDSPKYCSILLKFWPEVVSNKKNTVL